MKVRTCGNCAYYFEEVVVRGEAPAGFCRRYPPIPLMTNPEELLVSCLRPNVLKTEWCGEHRPQA